MLTLQKCRSLLGADCKLTDAELEQLRQELYGFADVAVEAFCASRRANNGGSSTSQNVSECLSQIPEQERQGVEERAAILEYEANLTKPEAERQAFGEWQNGKNAPGKRRKVSRKKCAKSRKK